MLTCKGCGYDNVNPEPDEEGDYVCAECGEILEVKVILCSVLYASVAF